MAEMRVIVENGIGGILSVGPSGALTAGPADAQTSTVYSSANAPGAGGAVATLAAGSMPAGLYDFEVYVTILGTVAAAVDTDNMEFREGGASVGRCPIVITGTTPAPAWAGPYGFRRRMTGVDNVSVNAVGAATASSVYRAQIKAVRVAD